MENRRREHYGKNLIGPVGGKQVAALMEEKRPGNIHAYVHTREDPEGRI
jgi:hypothetical protein